MSARLNMPGETLCSILDNAAALRRLGGRWCDRGVARVTVAQRAWYVAGSAAHARSEAVRFRLMGRIVDAVAHETAAMQWETTFRAMSTKDDDGNHCPTHARAE